MPSAAALLTAIGAGLGILNLVLGYFLTRRALRQGMKSAMRTLLSGFFLRLVAVAGLAHYFVFFGQVRPGLYLALALLALTVWPIDRLLPAPRHQWVPAPTPGGQT